MIKRAVKKPKRSTDELARVRAVRAKFQREKPSLESLRACYRKLLNAYFGPKFVIDDVLELECMRIPHFYRAFYVYKYSTGLAAVSRTTIVIHSFASAWACGWSGPAPDSISARTDSTNAVHSAFTDSAAL